MNEAGYVTVSHRGTSRYEEKKSVFLGFAQPVSKEEDAIAFLSEIRSAYPDARHHVYAYLLNERSLLRYSDDHEPQGTAGLPVLDTIRKNGISDVAVVVVRYFGGTLLGTGGLVRAYTRSTSDALANAGVIRICPCRRMTVNLTYPDYQKIQLLLSSDGISVKDSVFTENVRIICEMAEEKVLDFSRVLLDLTASRAKIEQDELFFGFQEKKEK